MLESKEEKENSQSCVCRPPRILKGDKLSSLSRGHVRWRALAHAGPCATLALRPRRLHSMGGALKCQQLAHYRKELVPFGGSKSLRFGGQNQNWHTHERIGYTTLVTWGVPKASQRGIKSDRPYMWVDYHITLPSRGSPTLHNEGQNQKWPRCGQISYITPAV